MTVPDFQSIMLPLLTFAGDKHEHTVADAIEALSVRFNLTEQDRREMLPSGRQATFNNRVGWSRTYLAKAGLLQNVGQGRFVITDRGLEVLGEGLDQLNVAYLKQFPEFVTFHTATRKTEKAEAPVIESPGEMLEASYQTLKLELAEELLTTIKGCSLSFFEKLVVDLLVAMGYGGTHKDAAQAIGRSGDEGIDGIIKEDKLGLDIVYVQAKRWEGPVSRPTVQAFAGSLEGQRARKGVLITTSHFTSEAKDYVGKIEKKIILIDGDELTQLMIEHNVGVSEVETYSVKRVDIDYFEGGV
jgi:restriction system protein